MAKWLIKAGVGCSAGMRLSNEDNFYLNGALEVVKYGIEGVFVSENSVKFQLYGVFDGMGGEEYGEIASYIAAQMCDSFHKKRLETVYPLDVSLQLALNKLLIDMNVKICEVKKELKLTRMGSTAALICVSNGYIYGANLGDSRIYRMRNGILQQLSQDHTQSKLFEKMGIYQGKESENLLTQHLGIDSDEIILCPCFFTEQMKQNDVYLICSDGLTTAVTDEDICNVLCKKNNSREGCMQLLDAAINNGSLDNITIILLRMTWRLF